MAVAFDQTGTVNSASSVTSLTLTDDASASATVLLWVAFVNATGASSSVTASYGGTSMTQVGSPLNCGTVSTFTGFLTLFELASAPGTSTTITLTFAASAANVTANTISYTGVGSVGSLSTNHGSGTALSLSSVASATGDLVANAGVSFGNTAFTSYNQTSRFTHAASQGSLIFGDAAGAATDSFSVTSGSGLWGMGAVNLVPASGGNVTVSPASATVTITGGTPAVAVGSGNVTASPSSANVVVSGGTPVVTATSTATFGFDQVGTIATGTAVASLTVADNATSGATVFLWIDFVNNTGITTGLSAKYAGVSMTQVGTTFLMGTSGGFNGYMACFVLNSAPGGGGSVVVTLPGTESNAQANTISYTGVSTGGGFTLSHNSSTGSALSISSVASASGDTVTNCGISLGNATFSSYNQTSRYTHNTTSQGSMVMGDAAGASTVSFSTTSSASAVWGMCAIDMAPGAVSVAPTTATVTVAGGTPTVTATVSGVFSPTTATVAITGGTPTIIAPYSVSPASATVSITGGTPAIAQASGPFARVLNALNTGSTAVMQMIGDSTVWGYNDIAQATLVGWVGRMGIALGAYYNVTVKIQVWDTTSSSYDSVFTLHTGTNPGGIYIYDGARSGETLSYYDGLGSTLIPNLNPDVIIIGDGFNEASTSSFVSAYETYLTLLDSLCPNTPVICTTENRTIGTEDSDLVLWAPLFAAMITAMVPGQAPGTMNPPLQASPAMVTATGADVWVLDTQQAYPPDELSAWITGAYLLHPNSLGYAAQALWMLSQLDPPAVGTVYPTTATVAITGGTPIVTVTTGTTARPTTATVVITGGTPTVSMSANITASPTTATVHVTGDTPSIVATANVVVSPTTATVHVTGGTPLVVAGAFAAPTTATVHITTGTPVITGLATIISPAHATITITGTTAAVTVSGPPPLYTPARRTAQVPAQSRSATVPVNTRTAVVPKSA